MISFVYSDTIFVRENKISGIETMCICWNGSIHDSISEMRKEDIQPWVLYYHCTEF